MELYSIKMRGSKDKSHISGAEKIVEEKDINGVLNNLVNRAFIHKKGKSDFINIKIEKIDEDEIKYVKKLKVSSVEASNKEEAKEEILKILETLNIDKEKGKKILDKLYKIRNMRGAKIIDVDTLERVDPYKDRGVRVTFMDEIKKNFLNIEKNHFEEAIILASKVMSCKNIIGEICISDDLDYTKGYVSCKELGYIRVSNVKNMGEDLGGRIFLYKGKKEEIKETIEYLERQKVLIYE